VWALQWLLPQLPDCATRLVDVFGGGGSVTANRPDGWRGWYNDIDADLVRWVRLVADDPEEAQRLAGRWHDTADDFLRALTSDCPGAWALLQQCSWGATGTHRNPRSTWRATVWRNYVPSLPARSRAWSGVRITCRDFREVIPECGAQDMLYLDPPYVHDARVGVAHYGDHEMTDADHSAMLKLAIAHPGPVMISGYPSDLYDDALAGWTRSERPGWNGTTRRKVEVVWRNYELRDLWTRCDA